MNQTKEVNDADRQVGEAPGPSVLDAEGGLRWGEGVRFRLKRTLSPFPASDGSLYLIRNGSEEDFVVPDPTPRDLVVLETLAAGFVDQAELSLACERRGLDSEGIERAIADLDAAGLLEWRRRRDPLDPERRERFDRQLIYFADVGRAGICAAEEAQLRLARSTVVILGCGGLGSWVACGLTCAGVGELVLIDDDRVELSNLNRQLLFGDADVGSAKTATAKRALQAHDSRVGVRTVERRVRGPEDLEDVLEGADLLIATADWPPFELPRWVNRACLRAGVPYLTGGQFLPLSRVGPTVIPGETACLECEERRIRRDFPLYDEMAEFRTANPPTAATVGAACGTVGSMLATEAIHLLSGVVEPASLGAALILDMRTMEISREETQRDPDCPTCGALAPAASG